jgi:hypothetical protein
MTASSSRASFDAARLDPQAPHAADEVRSTPTFSNVHTGHCQESTLRSMTAAWRDMAAVDLVIEIERENSNMREFI